MTELTVTSTLTAAQDNDGGKTITGLIVPLGVVSEHTSWGSPVVIDAGAITHDDQLSRVKLLVDHDHAQPVGVCTSIDATEGGLQATFRIPDNPRSLAAWADAADGLRDGLSIGITVLQSTTRDGVTHVTAARLNEVSLCALPAWADARVSIAATRQEPKTMTEQNPEETPAPEPTPDPPFAQAAPVLATARTGNTLTAATATLAGLIAEGATANQLNAALADITTEADPGQGFLRDSWIGELWTARRTGRPWIDSISTAALGTGTRVYGWRWKTRPTVGEYLGDKTEIPTSQAATEPIEASIERTAGGWDVDRIYVDLADSGMLSAIFAAAIEDYQAKTDAKVRAALLKEATAVPASQSLPAALTALGSAAAQAGSSIGFIGLASDVWAGLTAMTRNEIPWWMGNADAINLGTTTGTIGGLRVFNDPALGSGKILAGDKRAATWYEKNPPVRVQAVDLPRGGVDIAVFGYHALLVNDPQALFSTSVTAPSGPAA